LVKKLSLTDKEKADLVEFLKALSGEPVKFTMPKLP
jgi:cytochrome c peroxidase